MTTGAAAEVARWLGGPLPAVADGCPHLAWAASGAMLLTGRTDGPPALAPGAVVPLLEAIDEALLALTAALGRPSGIEPATVLGARAGLRPLARNGRISVGGSTRLLATQDGWVAVALARTDDVESVPAMFGTDPGTDPWAALVGAAVTRQAADFVERVRLFGVPAAVVAEQVVAPPVPWSTTRLTAPVPGLRLDDALVVDLSSLWAGPLCSRVLGRAGARVIKVESIRRPDGARTGEPRFYDWLHAGHESVAVDLQHPEDRASVAALLRSADVVIEASRPRALTQLGLAHDQLDLRPGVVWVSITGHGRDHPDLVAYGDDAAAAGGLVARDAGGPLFCGDAIGDPLTGAVAALAAVAARASGGGVLLDVAMSAVAAAFAAAPLGCTGEHLVECRRKAWFVTCPATDSEQRVLGPRSPAATGRAPALGADNDRLLGLAVG